MVRPLGRTITRSGLRSRPFASVELDPMPSGDETLAKAVGEADQFVFWIPVGDKKAARVNLRLRGPLHSSIWGWGSIATQIRLEEGHYNR